MTSWIHRAKTTGRRRVVTDEAAAAMVGELHRGLALMRGRCSDPQSTSRVAEEALTVYDSVQAHARIAALSDIQRTRIDNGLDELLHAIINDDPTIVERMRH